MEVTIPSNPNIFNKLPNTKGSTKQTKGVIMARTAAHNNKPGNKLEDEIPMRTHNQCYVTKVRSGLNWHPTLNQPVYGSERYGVVKHNKQLPRIDQSSDPFI